jgi:hypothetical protein
LEGRGLAAENRRPAFCQRLIQRGHVRIKPETAKAGDAELPDAAGHDSIKIFQAGGDIDGDAVPAYPA